MASRLDIKDMREVAQLRGGKCHSKEYIDLYTPLKWMCKKGHTWDASYTIIAQGGWCAQCARSIAKEERLKEYQQIAIERGGTCLSSEYITLATKLKWKCNKGHEWMAIPGNVRNGSWCPVCASTTLSIREMQAIAKKHGGDCLSKTYINSYSKLKWRCAQGHVWMAPPKPVKKGTWCVICAIEKKKHTLSDMQALAKKKNGKCLSSGYVNSKTPLRWQCDKKHIWMAPPSSIISGTWCRLCSFANHDFKYSINDMKALARQKSGKCLSLSYKGIFTKLKWQCRYKHIFLTTPQTVLKGTWCPACAGVLKYSIDELQLLAKKKQGKCLSLKYTNIKTKLKWQCKNKHIWMTPAASIIAGHWCPYCSKKAKHTIEQMHSLALKHGGKCLSATYKNVFTKLKWKCLYKHIFKTTPQSVLRGHWCPVCARQKNVNVILIQSPSG